MEENHNFNRVVINTDYRFSSVDKAVRKMEFFFGEKMAKSISEKKTAVVKEFTGIWYK
ncbi:MAG: hypothetical protein KAU17_06055 [Spirochaetales bacterium]|nr:hypothetical protein [Spirochaetales bacterium]